MHDPKLIELLYARQTLAECTAGLRTQADLPPASDLGRLVQAQLLLEQGNTAEARDVLRDVMEHAEESRVALWAGKALRDLGFPPDGLQARRALGVVIEVPMDESKDVMAVYRDNRVRFFSYGGAMAFYEPSANVQVIHDLCQQMMNAADLVKPLEGLHFIHYQQDSPRIMVLSAAGEAAALGENRDRLLEVGAYLMSTLLNLQQR